MTAKQTASPEGKANHHNLAPETLTVENCEMSVPRLVREKFSHSLHSSRLPSVGDLGSPIHLPGNTVRNKMHVPCQHEKALLRSAFSSLAALQRQCSTYRVLIPERCALRARADLSAVSQNVGTRLLKDGEGKRWQANASGPAHFKRPITFFDRRHSIRSCRRTRGLLEDEGRKNRRNWSLASLILSNYSRRRLQWR